MCNLYDANQIQFRSFHILWRVCATAWQRASGIPHSLAAVIGLSSDDFIRYVPYAACVGLSGVNPALASRS